MKKENIDIIIDKQLPVKQDTYPSLESILDPYKYSSIAGKETKDKIRIFEEEKKIFQRMIDKIRDLWDSTLLTRNPNRLDSQKKEVFESCQIEWDVTVHCLDYLEKQIKETSNELQNAFEGNRNGELYHQYAMIKQTKFQFSYEQEEVLVPDVIPGHLFYLLNTFCLLSSVAMNAIKIQYEVISLFENDPQEIGVLLNKELNPVRDYLLKFNGQMDDIKKGQERTQESIEQMNNSQKEIKDNQKKMTRLIINRNEIDEEKTGILSVDQCIILIGKIQQHYVDLRIADCRSVGLPPETVSKVNERTIKRYVEYWDQYLKGDKKRGRKPPRKEYSRNMSMEEYSKLFNAIEYDKYIKWRAKNRIVALSAKSPNQYGSK